MTIKGVVAVLALICIVVGFVVAVAEERFVLDPMGWFIASIALSLLALPERRSP